MPKFRSQFQAPREVHEPIGSRVKQLYAPVYDDRGILHLREAGKHDLYGEIQSHRDSVDIHVLLTRYRNGDESALSRIQGAYGDFTQMPTTFSEALNTFLAAEAYFDALPVEVRAKYGHNFHQFISAFDSPTFASDIGLIPPPSASADIQLPRPSVPNTEGQSEANKTPDTPASPAPAQPVVSDSAKS